jgi:hypothetical protein
MTSPVQKEDRKRAIADEFPGSRRHSLHRARHHSKRSLSIEIASSRGHSPEMVVKPLRSQIRTAAVIVTLPPR